MADLTPRLRSNISPASKSHLRDILFAPLEEDFHNFFNDFFAVNRKTLSHGLPKLDVYEHHDKFVVEYAMAGVDPNDITVELLDSHEGYPEYGKQLKVSGKMSHEYEHKAGAQYHVKELSRKNCTRTMLLPKHITTEPEATYHHGMLTLTWHLPKHHEPESTVKSIPVHVKETK